MAYAAKDLADHNKTSLKVGTIKARAALRRCLLWQRAILLDFEKIFMADQLKIVAVIDDDPQMRASTATLLQAHGYRAETFDSAETFFACVSSSKAVCLVVDIQLRDISGIELARQLTMDGFKFPIIFMTGLDDETVKRRADAAGGIAFLTKPFQAKTLIDAIKKAVE
jgi:FixJ family two-component response regulator